MPLENGGFWGPAGTFTPEERQPPAGALPQGERASWPEYTLLAENRTNCFIIIRFETLGWLLASFSLIFPGYSRHGLRVYFVP
jgi:hypothetical protein